MGKPTGFLEFDRTLPGKDKPEERIKHSKEFVHKFEGKVLNEQSARCMNCGVPFCHNGCPLGNFIPDFNDAVYREDWRGAYEVLQSTNNFPEFTGRLCPAPCEEACVLGINKPAVAIEEIEKHIIEIAFENNFVQPKVPRERTGKKVAVIGSGPAGLAAAAQLNYAGHTVTVYERDDNPGGLLRYGIPDFKLEKWVVERRIKLMEEEGVVFKCNMHVGVNSTINDLLRENQAIVLAMGSTIPRDLNIPGRDLNGVYFAMQFLKQQNKRVAGIGFDEAAIMATGKDVVVIGGGDTGSDCVGTSNRHGAVSITQFELLPKPPVARTPQMPWPEYPMLLKVTSSHEEGCERLWAVTTKEFIGDGNGNLTALRIANVEWKTNADGVRMFSEVPGSERVIPCQLALLAMGFLYPDKNGLITQLELELDNRGNVRTAPNHYQTKLHKVFACGDMRRGQSLIVHAIAEGRECARKVDEYLMGESLLETRDNSLLSATM